ncbi:hypothetical protein PENSPDRAFT_654817 [Peniophora sp. CONT]|nr:hypothetical protein PENSPDRAFT_654817 [Peniophora sp. CONT]
MTVLPRPALSPSSSKSFRSSSYPVLQHLVALGFTTVFTITGRPSAFSRCITSSIGKHLNVGEMYTTACSEPSGLHVFLAVPLVYLVFFIIARWAGAPPRASMPTYQTLPRDAFHESKPVVVCEPPPPPRRGHTQPAAQENRTGASEGEKPYRLATGTGTSSSPPHSPTSRSPCRCAVCRVRIQSGVRGSWHTHVRPPSPRETLRPGRERFVAA